MFLLWADLLLYSVVMLAAGAIGAQRLLRSRAAAAKGGDASHWTTEMLKQLARMSREAAAHVDRHAGRVDEISQSLTDSGIRPAAVLGAVQRVIEANRTMQERLATTEDRLRNQARQLEVHAVEARTDPLTLVANRRALNEAMERCLGNFRSEGRAFSLAIADLDLFKRLNDTHGHRAGDEVLRNVAAVLGRKARQSDLVARLGGEEFAILMPDTMLVDGYRVAEDARQAVGAGHYVLDGVKLAVTASMGLAEALESEDLWQVYQRADTALYAAKSYGRDCLRWHDGRQIGSGRPPRPDRSGPPAVVAATAREQAAEGPGDEHPVRPRQPAAESLADFLGLPSRTIFCQNVRARLAEWRRGGDSFSIVLLDLGAGPEMPNGFSPQVQARVATMLKRIARQNDLAAFYASGCFALLMARVEPERAARVADCLRLRAAQLLADDGGPALTVRTGVAGLVAGDELVALLRRAETALRGATATVGQTAPLVLPAPQAATADAVT